MRYECEVTWKLITRSDPHLPQFRVLKQIYLTDLTDSQCEHIRDLLRSATSRSRPGALEMRRVVDTIFYLVTGDIQ